MEKHRECKPQDLANILHALNSLGVVWVEGFWKTLRAQVLSTCDRFIARDVSTLLRALAMAGETRDDEVLKALLAKTEDIARVLEPRDVSTILWAVTPLNPPTLNPKPKTLHPGTLNPIFTIIWAAQR